MRTRAVVVTCLLLAAAGCSSDGPASAPSSPATSAPTSSAQSSSATSSSAMSTPPSSTASTPTAWTLEVARANFLSYVAPINSAMDDYAALGGHPLLKPLRRSCAAIATAMADAARKFAVGLWPGDVKSKVDRLVTGLTKERAGWLACAKAHSKKLAYKATRTRYRAAALGEQARIALGLPAVK